ncbi:MAG: electron transfer flavoprotein subunit beta/FixA family protein [Kofleriaceae bacterium]
MKILVPMKRVADPAMKIKLKDGAVDLTGASYIISTFDEYAIEAALRLCEDGSKNARLPDTEIVVVTLGPDEAAKELRKAMGMGADRAIHVVTTDGAIDAIAVAKVLEKIVAEEKPDLVIMGKQAVDGDANQVGQMLAGKLGWPQATFAASIELGADKASALVGREVDDGVEYKRVPTPALITVDLRIVAPTSVKNGVTPADFAYPNSDGARIAPLKGIMAAKSKPLATKALADFGVGEPVIREQGVELMPARAAGQFVPDVPTLVNKLVTEAKVL